MCTYIYHYMINSQKVKTKRHTKVKHPTAIFKQFRCLATSTNYC